MTFHDTGNRNVVCVCVSVCVCARVHVSVCMFSNQYFGLGLSARGNFDSSLFI